MQGKHNMTDEQVPRIHGSGDSLIQRIPTSWLLNNELASAEFSFSLLREQRPTTYRTSHRELAQDSFVRSDQELGLQIEHERRHLGYCTRQCIELDTHEFSHTQVPRVCTAG